MSARILEEIANLKKYFGERFDRLDGRLERIEGCLDRIEGCLDRIEGRLT